jgi:hypothetical protein
VLWHAARHRRSERTAILNSIAAHVALLAHIHSSRHRSSANDPLHLLRARIATSAHDRTRTIRPDTECRYRRQRQVHHWLRELAAAFRLGDTWEGQAGPERGTIADCAAISTLLLECGAFWVLRMSARKPYADVGLAQYSHRP